MNIAEAINAEQQKWISSRKVSARWPANRASGIGEKCARRIYYHRTCGELVPPVDDSLQAIFEEGNDQEPGVRRYLSELGFEVIQAQSVADWPKYQIRGHVDGVIEWEGQRYLAEIKTISEIGWNKLQSLENVINDAGYYAKWYAQIQTYLLLFELETGLLILKRKNAKQLRVIEVPLDMGFAEGLIQRVEEVNDCVAKETPPDFIEDPTLCRKCPFYQGGICSPPLDMGEMILNIENPDLAEKLEQREKLAGPAEEYGEIDQEVKKSLKEIPNAICGDYRIIGKERVVNYKACEAKVVKQWVTKIERI